MGDEEFELKCIKCENEIKFKKNIKELLVTSDYIKERIHFIKEGKQLGLIELEEDKFKLDDEMTINVSIPQIEKHIYLSKLELPLLMYWKLLHMSSITFHFPEEDVNIPLNEKTIGKFVEIFNTRPTAKFDEFIVKQFSRFEVKFSANVKCNQCGTINTTSKDDLLEELVFRALS